MTKEREQKEIEKDEQKNNISIISLQSDLNR